LAYSYHRPSRPDRFGPLDGERAGGCLSGTAWVIAGNGFRGVYEAIAPMKFVYQGLQRDGRLVTGSIEAVSERSAHRDLSRRGVRPTAIRSEAAVRPVQRRKPARRDYALMLKQLHTLLAGGVPLADAVTSLTPNDASSLGVALVELNTGLRRGEPFARTFARCFPGIPGYVQRMLESGELSGRLAEAVADAAAAMEHTARVQAELRNALIYPAFLVGCRCNERRDLRETRTQETWAWALASLQRRPDILFTNAVSYLFQAVSYLFQYVSTGRQL
jgi:hypothetical protein